MLCTDIRLLAEDVDKAFMRAWNFLVSHGMRYAASFREMDRDGENESVCSRAKEIGSLLDSDRILKLDYGVMMKVIRHIEVNVEGTMVVIFIAGTKLMAQSAF